MRSYLALVLVLAFQSCSRHENHQAVRFPSRPDGSVVEHPIAYPAAIRDTVVEKPLFLGRNFPVGRFIWTVEVTPPDDQVHWSICAIVDEDTAFLHKGDSGWFKPTASRSNESQDTTSLKVPWYTRDFFEFQRDSIPTGDPRRKIAERFPRDLMARYLREHGMGASAASQAEAAFWTYYRDIPIITFRFPEFPAGGDQRNFAYHPKIRWFLPVSLP
jgi:hypothetical protein